MIQKRFFYSKEELSKEVEDEFSGKEAVAANDFEPGKTGRLSLKELHGRQNLHPPFIKATEL